ncbi:MupA/Atu3671 family FMN-dependent luciferase-like monooxygenase [Sedimentitalea sp. XS_ASV28]|uniref:MupA/Atu3671 family FMN-dependent luciferase-like monooxygenase n=1 Tax=Sedimentitalea sp. XS_ASV28 TaxID=3241296 RepID=UPI00351137EC
MPLSAILIGNESLLVQCATLWQERGHGIAAVVTRNPDIRSWAEAAGLRVEAPGKDLEQRLAGVSCDWLLSIANLSLVPDGVLALAGKGAVNFHDGPLPAYAGLNVPVWAILNGETSHAITWHHITQGIDEGNILVSRSFDIGAQDTALTLNTKCYAEAIDSFPELVAMLETGQTAGTAQDFTSRRVFARADRPSGGGRLDFSAPAAEVARLVRALDHGPYWNPLAAAKFRHDGGVILVHEAGEVSGSAPAGTVLAAGDNSLTVACGTGAVRLAGLSDISGEPAQALPATGTVLPVPDAGAIAAIDAALAATAPQEGHWRKALASLDPVRIGDTGATAGAADWHRTSHAVPLAGDRLMAALAIWAARLSGMDRFDLAFSGTGQPRLAGTLSDWVPLGVDVTGSLGAISAHLRDGMAKAAGKGGFALDLPARDPALRGLGMPAIGINLADTTPIPGTVLTLCPGERLEVISDAARLDDAARDAALARLDVLATALAGAGEDTRVAELPGLGAQERQKLLFDLNDTATDHDRSLCLHQLIEAQVARTPDATALVFETTELTYAALNARANRIAHVLKSMGVGPEVMVGLYLPRGLDLVIAAIAIQKAGGAYVPLDPAYPADRIAYYLEDSEAPVVVTQSAMTGDLPPHGAEVLELDRDPRIASAPQDNADGGATPENLAYVIYTSGSTGRPKGVMVEHRNVVNFCVGMDARIPHEDGAAWLAVTSLSFDISVLELFWTLARGFKLVVLGDDSKAMGGGAPVTVRTGPVKPMDFSLFYWGNDDGVGPRKYELLLEGARIADRNGFKGLWTPERHFHAFGGPFPNPSVTGAAVAAVTKNLEIRAGSCVSPLHHPARIAEEWAVIDNLTNGRTGLAIASGWQPDDFVLRPENTPPDNKPAMLQDIETLRKLWRGEEVAFPRKDGTLHPVVTQPRPVSKELKIWVTTAGNPETWKEAGALGANVLTHLLGQSVAEVGEKIGIYHDALREAGHDPDDFTVTLMLHTYIAQDRETAREVAREPMKDYLRSAAGLIKQYAWAFPAFKKPKGVDTPFQLDLGSLSEDELEGILDFAFLRYFEDSGLFGTVEDCMKRVEEVRAVGVGEIACLIDYGIPVPQVLEGLTPLSEVLRAANAETAQEVVDVSIRGQIRRHGVTHMQCTPSMARLIFMQEEAGGALAQLKHLMIGGEALPAALVDDLNRVTDAHIENMYGPTETTIWSATGPATADQVDLGTPIANTQLYILDNTGQPVPEGVPGELWIGGEGVTRGYHKRAEQTADRFRSDPFRDGNRIYGTGDLVCRRPDGGLDFLGRIDNQVKIRGYRIELGEIESRLNAHDAISEAVVIAREDTPGDQRLVAYMTGSDIPDDAALRRFAEETLPPHMIPAHYVTLAAFPLTPNKKVDRKALPRPQATPQVSPPATGTSANTEGAGRADAEAIIRAVWTRLLGVHDIPLTANFFDLGGHSLLAVQAFRELKAELGNAKLQVTDIFRFPTLGALSDHLRAGSKPAATPATPTPATVTPDPEPAAAGETKMDAMARRRALRMSRRR